MASLRRAHVASARAKTFTHRVVAARHRVVVTRGRPCLVVLTAETWRVEGPLVLRKSNAERTNDPSAPEPASMGRKGILAASHEPSLGSIPGW